MNPTFRTLALTAALSALTSVASAAEVKLDFNALGEQADKIGKPVPVPATGGLNFGGAYVYGQTMLAGIPGFANLALASTTRGGMVLSRAPGTDANNDIILSLVQNTATARATSPAVFFDAITFRLFTKGTGDDNRLFATGPSGEDKGTPLTGGGGDRWSILQTYDFDPQAQITSLRFNAGGAAFALDDMLVTLTADPGVVPEPASYGLVGLALLAAGAASRRKQRG